MKLSVVWRVWRGLLALAGLLILNASLTFANVWPTPAIRWEYALSVELAVCVLIIAAAQRRARALTRRVLPFLWVLLVFGHYADVTAPGLYGREFNLYWDSRHLSNVAAMLIRDVPWLQIAAAAAVVALALTIAFVGARLSLRAVARAAEIPTYRYGLGLTAIVLLLCFAGQRLFDRFPQQPAFADPVSAAYLKQARFVAGMVLPGAAAPVLRESPFALNSDLHNLRGADVLLLFVESYGAITVDNPTLATGLAASRLDLANAIREAGRDVVSAYVEAPTFGGSSWLSHLSLMSGVEVRDQYSYSVLMTQPRPTLVTTFARQGYRTLSMMPGLRQEWPEGAFYKFDVIYDHDMLEYKGPQFGWWSVPDQYTLAKLDDLELKHLKRKPVFAVFPTSTTHAPFGPVAPFQPDWSKVLTPDAYDKADVERALALRPNLTNLSPSYVHALAYEFNSLAGYVRQRAGDNMVMIVIGDHQPPAVVSGRNASWDVPVHVISSSESIIRRLRDHGFGLGLDVSRQPIGAMHELVPMLLDAFGSWESTSNGISPGRAAIR